MYERSQVASEVHDAPCENGRPTPHGMCVKSFAVRAARRRPQMTRGCSYYALLPLQGAVQGHLQCMHERLCVVSEVHSASCENGRPDDVTAWANLSSARSPHGRHPRTTRGCACVLLYYLNSRAEERSIDPGIGCLPSSCWWESSVRVRGFPAGGPTLPRRRASATAEGKSDAVVWSTQGGARDSKWASGHPGGWSQRACSQREFR